MKALALDFDGVICRSRAEVLRTAVETWQALGLAPTIPAAIFREGEAAERFDRLAPLGNRAEDFGVALHILAAGLEVEDQALYNAIRDGLGRLWLETFHHAFYDIRKRRRLEDPQGWLALHEPYHDFVEILSRRGTEATLAITTAKDGASVRLLLDFFGIRPLFRDDLILDKELGISKQRHLRALAEKLGLAFADITFVDDKLNHVLSVGELGVRVVMAGWGYNTRREAESARGAGVEVASLDNAEGILFGS